MKNNEVKILVALAIILSLVGIYFIFDVAAARNPFGEVARQSISLVAGLALMSAMVHVRPRALLAGKWPYVAYGCSLLLIVLCFIPINTPFFRSGESIFGAYRWFRLFGYSIQVAELVKLGMIIFFAYLFTRTTDWKIFLLYLSVPTLLMLVQKDLGSLLVVYASVFGLYILAGAPLKNIAGLCAAGLVGVILMIVLAPYRMRRLTTFLHPEADLLGDGYQINQMLIAIGRGGAFGQGLGQSRQKFGKVPVVSSDSIFSIMAEEIGFVGVTIVLLLLALFVICVWHLVETADVAADERLLGFGIYLSFLSQIFINIAAISGTMPLTGITLPFISSGGSSLAVSLALVGLVVALAKDQPAKERAAKSRLNTAKTTTGVAKRQIKIRSRWRWR
ncbi:FtsW/RodA/SpoVE family cell cycle protein [bacterium]|nr:FtsW/RodA/SpoVE family cell cycle protein [bacterium]